MLHPDTKQIAEELTGYIPFSEVEADAYLQTNTNYMPELYSFEDADTHPSTGSVYRKGFTLMFYWVPEATEN